MALNIMVPGQCSFVSVIHLLLSPYSISLSSDTHTCSAVWPLKQLENQHLGFLWLNKAVVCICQSYILCPYVVGVKTVSGSLSSGFGNNVFYIP